MEKGSGTVSRSSQVFTAATPSPRLVRSRSGNTLAVGITTPERISLRRFSMSERFINNGHRSKSTSRCSTRISNHENIKPVLMTTSIISNTSSNTTTMSLENNKKKKSSGVHKLLSRGTSPENDYRGALSSSRASATTGMKVPSAWALSPGRTSLGSPIPAWYESPAAKPDGGSRGGVTNKLLKYFTQRKVSRVEEEQYHRFKIMHNRLLQWRFINARAEIAMTSVNNVSQIQLFSVWLKTLVIRKMVVQKRIALQKIKHLIKLHQILNPQFSLLEEWEKMEKRNKESIARLTRKLSALSTTLPLTHDIKADTQSVSEALDTAIKVMDNIEPFITRFQAQAERILYRVTELITASKQEEEYLNELLGILPMITTLLENEKSNQVYLIQRVALY